MSQFDDYFSDEFKLTISVLFKLFGAVYFYVLVKAIFSLI